MIDVVAGLRISTNHVREPCALMFETRLFEQRAEDLFRFHHCFTATMQSAYFTCGARYVWL